MKVKLKGNKVLLILGLIYTLISILAISSYISRINSISNTPVTFLSVIGDVWWQLLMIALFVVTYFLYSKKPVLGALLEMVMGMAMLVYIIISIAMMGPDLFAIIIELIYPLVLVFHGLKEFKKINKKKNKIKQYKPTL